MCLHGYLTCLSDHGGCTDRAGVEGLTLKGARTTAQTESGPMTRLLKVIKGARSATFLSGSGSKHKAEAFFAAGLGKSFSAL